LKATRIVNLFRSWSILSMYKHFS